MNQRCTTPEHNAMKLSPEIQAERDGWRPAVIGVTEDKFNEIFDLLDPRVRFTETSWLDKGYKAIFYRGVLFVMAEGN